MDETTLICIADQGLKALARSQVNWFESHLPFALTFRTSNWHIEYYQRSNQVYSDGKTAGYANAPGYGIPVGTGFSAITGSGNTAGVSN